MKFSAIATVLGVVASGLASVSASETAKSVVIKLDETQTLSVRYFDPARGLTIGPASLAVVVWSDQQADKWQFLASDSRWNPQSAVPTGVPQNTTALFAQSRSTSVASTSEAESSVYTTQLDQLLGTTTFRGKQGFTTPAAGNLLNPKITIRRSRQSGEVEFPVATAVLLRGNQEVGRVSFASDQESLAYDEVPSFVEKYPDGLPSGEYSLRLEGSSESVLFTVEDNEWFEIVTEDSNRLGDLLSSRVDPLYAQVAVETLLEQVDEDGRPMPYLCDALDVLESIPESSQTTRLKILRRTILEALDGTSETALQQSDNPAGLIITGIPAIDRVRKNIASGNWNAASLELDQSIPNEPRAMALANLHRAIILAQSGMGMSRSAEALFIKSLNDLKDGRESDLFLANINAGNFLLSQAQDQLYNHAFQIAAGVRDPLLKTLASWINADTVLKRALVLSTELDSNQQAAARISRARLYVLLADILQTLDIINESGERSFLPGELAAAKVAIEMACEVTEQATGTDPLIVATAEEILAHLAYRAKRSSDCEHHARRALALYQDAGSLAGVEGIQRLLGMYYMRSAEFAVDGVAADGTSELALNHFLISMHLAELLRSRIPADQYGMAHAGFFARRAYVNEQVIELLVADGKAEEALIHAENAKARSLQELLATNNEATGEFDDEPSRTLSDLLNQWPANTAAVEYFLGTEKVWLFAVDTSGEVHAWELLNDQQASRTLIADIRSFLNGIEGQAGRMYRRLSSGKGYDHTWQDQLFNFKQMLLPEAVMEKLGEAETVVLVPHHVLHYFPFAALVTQRDTTPRKKTEMVQPKFLVDETFNLVHAPSLQVWDQLRRSHGQSVNQVSAVGIVDFPGAPQLKGVAEDIENLRTSFGDKVRDVLFAEEATESNALRLLQQPGMVLFATHGFNEAERPLESYLLCLKDQTTDGHLTASELFQTKIQANLIVMSACYSGLADKSPMPGDDLFGIQRAFLQSGSRTVVSGLWDVYDGTGPELMKTFFSNLADGRSSSASLADSQRAFLAKHRSSASDPFGHPYFWSVYTVAGDGDTHVGDVIDEQ